MSLTQKLRDLITKHMTVPGAVPEIRPEADFVISGLRAATAANMITRRKILSDVSDVLSCSAEDLEFLFTDIPSVVPSTAHHDLMVPDFRSNLYALAE